MDSSSTTEAIALAFVERYWADRAEGRTPNLADFLRQWPGHEELIAQEFFAAEEQAGEKARERLSTHNGGSEGEERLGPYRILRELGRGGQAMVYLAEDTRLHRKVALKVLTGLGPGADMHIKRFRREAEVASKLDHPGICGVHDAGIEGGVPYIAMPYVEGTTLAAWIADARAGRPAEAKDQEQPAATTTTSTLTREQLGSLLDLFEKAARALHAAHEAGILHRDIKPGNIMVTKSGDPVILDFGLARDDDPSAQVQTLTQTGDLFGTPAYMSPEQIAGQRIKLDRRSDVYSLGVTLYECLTLKRPFDAPTRESLYQSILSKTPPDPRKLNRSIPPDVKVILDVVLDKDRDRRYQSAEALADDLRGAREGKPIAAKPIGPVGKLLRWTKREPAKATLLIVLLIALPAIAALAAKYFADRPQVAAARAEALRKQKDEMLAAAYSSLEEEPARAAENFMEVMKLPGEQPEAITGLAFCHGYMHSPAEGLAILDAHTSQIGSRAGARFVRDFLLHALGRTSEADAIGQPGPADDIDFFAQGEALFARWLTIDSPTPVDHAKLIGAAVDALVQAVLRAPKPRAYYYERLAIVAGRAQRKDIVDETVSAMTFLWPRSAGSHNAAAESLLYSQRFVRALAEARLAVELNPDFSPGYRNLARILTTLGHPREAAEAARNAVRLDPKSWWTLTTLASALINLHDVDGAIAACRRALELQPRANVRGALAIALAEKGLLDDADRECREVFRVRPGDPQTKITLAHIRSLQNRPADAERLLREVILQEPGDAMCHALLAPYLAAQARVDDAIHELQEAIRLDPDCLYAYTLLGDYLHCTAKFRQAVDAYEHALAINASDVKALTGYSTLLMDLGRLPQAGEALAKAIAANPNDAEPRAWLGQLLLTRGLFDRARQELLRALEVNARNGSVHEQLAILETQEGDYDRALSELRELLRLEPENVRVHSAIGFALMSKGAYRDALPELRLGVEVYSRWSSFSGQFSRWADKCERLLECEDQLERVLEGADKPEGAENLLDFATVAAAKHHHLKAATWYREACAQDPNRFDGEDYEQAFAAASAAILAAASGSQHGLDIPARSEWRRQGLAWARAAVVGARSPKGGDFMGAASVLWRMSHGPHFTSVRGDAALACLPANERSQWKMFWAEVDQALSAFAESRPESRENR